MELVLENGFAPRTGVPTPGHGPVLIRKQVSQQEVSGRQASKASLVVTATPLHSHYRLSSASSQICCGIRLRSTNPVVNCACEGSKFLSLVRV